MSESLLLQTKMRAAVAGAQRTLQTKGKIQLDHVDDDGGRGWGWYPKRPVIKAPR